MVGHTRDALREQDKAAHTRAQKRRESAGLKTAVFRHRRNKELNISGHREISLTLHRVVSRRPINQSGT